MKVLIVDQFSSLTPYAVSQLGCTFEELCEHALTQKIGGYKRPEVQEINAQGTKWRPAFGSTVFKANVEGFAVVHMTRWDT